MIFEFLQYWILIIFFIRLLNFFERCREEEKECEISIFAKPLGSAKLEKFVNFRIFSFLFGSIFLFGILFRFLGKNGNLNENSILSLGIRIFLPFGVFFCNVRWLIFFLLPDFFYEKNRFVFEIFLPVCVHFSVFVLILAWIFDPILICIKNFNPTEMEIPADSRRGPMIDVFRFLRQNWNSLNEQPKIFVFGLATIFSAAWVSLAIPILLAVFLFLGDGFVPSLAIQILLSMVLLELSKLFDKILIIHLFCKVDLKSGTYTRVSLI